jgi:hypothetical protein
MPRRRSPRPNPHKVLAVKRKYFPRPRGVWRYFDAFAPGSWQRRRRLSVGDPGCFSATRLALSKADAAPGLWRPAANAARRSGPEQALPKQGPAVVHGSFVAEGSCEAALARRQAGRPTPRRGIPHLPALRRRQAATGRAGGSGEGNGAGRRSWGRDGPGGRTGGRERTGLLLSGGLNPPPARRDFRNLFLACGPPVFRRG